MNISKDEIIEEIVNLEDILSRYTKVEYTLSKDLRKNFYSNYNMEALSNRHNNLIQILGSMLKPSSAMM